jgi:beta-N-acetylhexosaminidase
MPFRSGIEAGADIVMTSHIKFPKIDPENPATLSKKILADILRGALGFSGLILSDSMNMGAIRKFYDPAESTLLALKAGVDVVMLSEEHYDYNADYLKKQLDSIEIVKNAIESGILSETEVNEKLYRILDLKLNRMKLNGPALSSEEKAVIAADENRATYAAYAMLQKGLWPLPQKGPFVCVNATPRDSYSNIVNVRGIGPNQAKPAFDTFREAYGSLEKQAVFVDYEEIANASPLLETSAAIIVVTEDYPLPGEDFEKGKQQALVNKLCKDFGEKLIILGLRSSYELSAYPEGITYLCAYSSRTCSAMAAAEILAKGAPVSGTPPVTVRI